MAKDLPFFKFFPSEWNDGNVVDCSMEAQGLFINICSLYWSREGALDNATAKRKLCGGNAKAYKELISAKIIKVSATEISIAFLDEQLAERKVVSEKSREIANKRWKKDADALPPHSEGNANAMPEEKRREDKIREEEVNDLTLAINTFLQRKSQNTMEVRSMVQQWVKAGYRDIQGQVAAMKACYQRQNLVFPMRIETLTKSFQDSADWREKLKDLDPERVADNIQKQKNGTRKNSADEIGTSPAGSLE